MRYFLRLKFHFYVSCRTVVLPSPASSARNVLALLYTRDCLVEVCALRNRPVCSLHGNQLAWLRIDYVIHTTPLCWRLFPSCTHCVPYSLTRGRIAAV